MPTTSSSLSIKRLQGLFVQCSHCFLSEEFFLTKNNHSVHSISTFTIETYVSPFHSFAGVVFKFFTHLYHQKLVSSRPPPPNNSTVLFKSINATIKDDVEQSTINRCHYNPSNHSYHLKSSIRVCSLSITFSLQIFSEM